MGLYILLSQLWEIEESVRSKAIKLLTKIFRNLLNHLSETNKFGNLKLQKIRNKLSQCQPAFDLLILSGFEEAESDDDTRLIWKNSDESLKLLKQIYNALRSDEK